VRAAHPFFAVVKGQMRRQGQYQENRPALESGRLRPTSREPRTLLLGLSMRRADA
jgi:hypothetical protein